MDPPSPTRWQKTIKFSLACLKFTIGPLKQEFQILQLLHGTAALCRHRNAGKRDWNNFYTDFFIKIWDRKCKKGVQFPSCRKMNGLKRVAVGFHRKTARQFITDSLIIEFE